MIFKRYIDIALGEDEYLEGVRIETDVPKGDILTISPMINNYGAKLKKVTLMTDRYGNQYKVQGNFKDIIKEVRVLNKPKIGY